MLTFETLRLLKNLLLEVARGEQKLELIRQKLASFEDFEPYEAFQRVHRNRKEYINADEVIEFLKDNKIYCVTSEEAQYLINFFDSNSERKLKYPDFLQMLVPCDNNFLRCEVTQRPTHKVEKFQYLPMHIELELSSLMLNEIELFRKTEEMRRDLERRHDFSTFACFRAVDDLNEGAITPDNLRSFFKNNGYYPTEDEVIAIIRRLDVDADCKISYAEFSEAIKTQEFTLLRESVSQSPYKPSDSLGLSTGPLRGASALKSSPRAHEESKYLSERQFSPSRSHLQVSRGAGLSQSQYDRNYQSPSRPLFRLQPERQNYSGSGSALKKSSPLRPREEDELIKAFREQLILERELEKAKIDLIEFCCDFNLYDAFRLIDREAKGYVTPYDLQEAFDHPAVLDIANITKDDIELYMSRYDKNQDRRIRFSEFSASFSPCDPYFKDKLESRKATDYTLSEKTRLMYRNLWMTHFKIEQQAEFIRQRLSSRAISTYDAFQAVDENQDGKITKDELRRVIERDGFSVTHQEINSLMDRYDKNGDGVISFSEFSDEIRPHSPSRRPIY